MQDGCDQVDRPGARQTSHLGPEGLQLQEPRRRQTAVGRGSRRAGEAL